MTTKLIKITDTTLRDAHQSLFATRFNNSTISKLAPVLDKVGYDVLEVWGGATFDSCIRYLNEDPWDRLKTTSTQYKSFNANSRCKFSRISSLFRRNYK